MEYKVFPPKEQTVTAAGFASFFFLKVAPSTYFPPRKKLHWEQFGGFLNVEYLKLHLGQFPVPLAVYFPDVTYNAQIVSVSYQ